jgi:hypothetical protein
LKNDVNVASKSNKQKNLVKEIFFAAILKVSGEKSRITDTQHLVAGQCVTAVSTINLRRKNLEVKGLN